MEPAEEPTLLRPPAHWILLSGCHSERREESLPGSSLFCRPSFQSEISVAACSFLCSHSGHAHPLLGLHHVKRERHALYGHDEQHRPASLRAQTSPQRRLYRKI